MTFAEAYQHSVDQIGATKSPALILGSGRAKNPVSLNRVSLTKDMAGDFAEIAKDAVPQFQDITLLAYNASYKPDLAEVMYLPLSEDARVKAVIDDLAAFHNIPLLKTTKANADTENLRLYSMVVGADQDDRVVLLRAVSERIEISKGHKVVALLRAGTFSKLRQKVFLFDRQVDCIAGGGFLFILNKKGFERLFQYYEQLKAHAAQAVEKVTEYVQINLQEFTEACTTQVRFMDKIASISRSSYLDKVTLADIKKVITEFNLSIPIVLENGIEKLVFESAPEKRWQILKLLDDDYLGSIMTHEKYAANSKIRVT